MIKIKNNKDLKWYLEKHAKNQITIKYTANKLKITPRQFKQLHPIQKNKQHHLPQIDQNLRQPKKQITQQTIKTIKQAYEKNQLGHDTYKKSYTQTKKQPYPNEPYKRFY
jgi:uncharacterized FlgJ-related protein